MAGSDETNPQIWELLDDRLLQACYVWDLRARQYRHPESGKEGEFYYIDSRDWVIVVARTTENKLVFIQQFRWGSNELSWELPGGIIDHGEDPVAAGLRELQEETGYVARSGRLIGQCQPNPAILNNHAHIVFADQVMLGGDGTDWDEHEEIEVKLLSDAEAFTWAESYAIGHALALVALLYYRLRVLDLEGHAPA